VVAWSIRWGWGWGGGLKPIDSVREKTQDTLRKKQKKRTEKHDKPIEIRVLGDMTKRTTDSKQRYRTEKG
jgi:hypothetical protein